MSELAMAVGPDSIEIRPRGIGLGPGFCATLAVVGYPSAVAGAWLESLLSWPGRLDTSIHITPVTPQDAASSLRRQRARLESSRRMAGAKGRLDDPEIEAAAQDAATLADAVARGSTKLFRTGIYLTVHARTETELAESVAQIRSVASSLLLDLQPVTWRHPQGWTSTLPLGVDQIGMLRTLDTAALAAALPLASPDLPVPLPGERHQDSGVLYGLNLATGGIVWWDRWSAENHNSVTLAPSGAGKSYMMKLEALRSLYQGIHVAVVDPESEYITLAENVGGTVVQLGAPGVKLNPLDLPAGDQRTDVLTRRALFLHTVVAALIGQALPAQERAALDRAIIDVYQQAGITADPGTWTRPAPLLRDLVALLAGDAGRTLAARLMPYTEGSFSGMFDGPTTSRPDGHLVVWSLRQLPDELRTIGTLLSLDTIWRRIDTPAQRRRRRLVIVDEGWLLLRDGAAAAWLYKMGKAIRKRDGGIAMATQDVGDVLSTELGRSVISNSATQILMHQAPQVIDEIAATFRLTDTERSMLLSARRGEALLVSRSHRVAFEVVASDAEHPLCIGDLERAGFQDEL